MGRDLLQIGWIRQCQRPHHPVGVRRPREVGARLADMTDRSPSLSASARRLTATLVLVLTATAFLAGCGSSSTTTAASSTPAYCSDVNNFKSDVAQLKHTGSPSSIIASITNVQSSGQIAISAVKPAIASQVAALKSSLAALANTAKQLTSSSTRASALHQLPAEITAVKTAAGKFVDATKCG
jgi:hypothetical protein